MKVISANMNGIRSATKKDFWPWFKRQKADILCMQEIRATEDKFPEAALNLKNYHKFIRPAEKPGYSGVSIYAKQEPKNVCTKIGYDIIDNEGRYLQLDYDKFSVASIYFPSGSNKESRQVLKYEFMEFFSEKLIEFKKKRRPIILCGDWNIAHKNIDIKNWRSNQKNSGFLPEERAWMDHILDELNYVDAFREVNQKADQYTWWSNRGRARENNVGWRIDYQIVSPKLKDKVTSASIYRNKFFSDHAPLTISYDI